MEKHPRQPKVSQTNDELDQHLVDNLQFLESSSDSYDTGYTGEAKRLAVTLRVLLHNTKNSHSLLQQLGRLAIPFFDTAMPVNPRNEVAHSGLTILKVEPNSGQSELLPKLDDSPLPTKWTAYGTWWNAQIIKDGNNQYFTRRDIVRYLADQDGGAHVDPGLDEVYANLSRQNSLGWFITSNGLQFPVVGPERASVRQIAHEVLKTLKPNYERHHPDFRKPDTSQGATN